MAASPEGVEDDAFPTQRKAAAEHIIKFMKEEDREEAMKIEPTKIETEPNMGEEEAKVDHTLREDLQNQFGNAHDD